MGFYVGVDVGGTFTDGVALDDAGRLYHAKSPTTREDPVAGMLNTLAVLAAECGLSREEFLASTVRLSLGTTIGTNLIVERKGARTGLLATAGHGDAILMMRGSGRTVGLEPEMYFHPQATDKPEPLVPRNLIREINERIDYAGRVIVPLNPEEVEAAVRSLVEEGGVTAIAIAFLWSFKNPVHERQAAEIVRRVAPQVYVSCSHQVAPRLGEYERTVATVINSYIGPPSAAYLAGAAERLKQAGLKSPPLVMQVAGGVVPAEAAASVPLTSLGSGPVGGLMGAAALARRLGHDYVVATDMGGTSFDVGLIVQGEPLGTEDNVINQYRYRLAQLQVTSIACGGGSIARVDPYSRSLRVGPESAGSNPGPVCYGRGGSEPTVTDADLVVGLLSAENFLGGRMPLDKDAALRALAALGKQVGLEPEEAAAGILRINNTKAAELIRQQTVVRGYDPRDFVVYAYGGAGPLHAFAFAPELGVKEVVIPLGNGASTLSAYGCATSDLVRVLEAEELFSYPFDLDGLNRVLSRLEAEAREAMAQMGQDPEGVELERFGLMRYRGQWLHHLLIRLPGGRLGPEEADKVVEDFRTTYDRLYGKGAGLVSQGIEMFTVRVRARARLGRPLLAGQQEADPGIPEPAWRGSRAVLWPESLTWAETQVYDGRFLRPGHRVLGPAVVELPHTSVPVAAGQKLICDSLGNLVLRFDADITGEDGGARREKAAGRVEEA